MAKKTPSNPLEAAQIIATLSNRIVELEHELDMTKKWGAAMAKRITVITDAIIESQKIVQEPSPNINYGPRV